MALCGEINALTESVKLTKVAFLCCSVFSLHLEEAHAAPAHTVKAIVIGTDGALIPEFVVTIKPVSQKPELNARKRFKSGEFMISGLTKDRYQLQIYSPLYIPARLDFDFKSSARSTEYSIVILQKYRNEKRLIPGAEYTISAKTLQEKIPSEAENAYMKGVTLHREGRLDEALIEYGSALRIYPNFLRALEDIGAVFILFNRPDSALTFLRRARDIDDRNIVVNLNTGIALTEQGDYSEALKLFKNVVSRNQRLALAHYYIARIHYLQKQYEEAEQSIQRAIESDPQLLEASILMIDISLQRKKYDQAREALLRVRQALDNKMISKFIDDQLSTLGS